MAFQEFVDFYKAHLKLEPADFEAFIASIQTPLHSTFRITPTSVSSKIRERMERYPFVSKVKYLNDVYTFNLKDKDTLYTEFIQFLVAQTNTGSIQRQEIVSFIAHKFLSLSSNHKVLETCASPGSKTKNILEVITDGILISNDKSTSRVNILISEAMKKANQNFIITQMDAAQFPTLPFKFDRICCDVPCTSDGTCRKNPAIMPKWNIAESIALSSTQLRILRRALELLEKDGILVYSTCSLNPIEDEWVIQKALSGLDGYELVDNFDFTQYTNEFDSKITVRKGITEFNFKNFEYKNEQLQKCFRILPHDLNTGGFFIAVIKRTGAPIQKDLQIVASLNKKFVELDTATISRIQIDYDISHLTDHYVSFNSNFKHVFAISGNSYEILSNSPKLKVAYAGIKAFTRSDLVKDAFRAKGAFLECANIQTDYKITFDDFKKLLTETHISLDGLETKVSGLFTCSVEGVSHKFCGFSGGNKVFLYIDDNSRKAYSQLYLE
ncbi:tRNA (cytosine(34)-C(5))-methyltransferase [Glugoides intestinalis]